MKKLLLTGLVCASTLFAQSDYKYEVTPMLGGAYTEGNLDLDRNYGNFGLSLGTNLDDSMFDQVELGFLRSVQDVDYKGNNGDTGITRVFTNFIKEYEISAKSSFYGLIGAGIEIFDTEKFNNEDGLFGNYGLGYKYKLDNDMAIKFDVRHLIETDHGDNNLLYTVGLAIPFGKKAAPIPTKQKMMKKEEPMKMMAPKDSDNDGVMDANDKCPNSPMGAKVDNDGCAEMVDLNIQFETNSSVIRVRFNDRVKAFADYMKDNKAVTATIEAHTDSVGSDKSNEILSERRAASAVRALKEMNIDESRLEAVGYGEYRPIADNKTKEGRAQNRRVHAIINR